MGVVPCRGREAPSARSAQYQGSARRCQTATMVIHYLEIVTHDVDTLTALYQRMHGLSFGPPDADLGQARVATRPDGTLIGIRKPLAAHEQSIVRTYLAVEDIQEAVKQAEESGAVIAYPPTRQGQRGTPGRCATRTLAALAVARDIAFDFEHPTRDW